MCCPRPGADFRRFFSELAARPAKANSQPRTTIFCDEAALLQDAVSPVREMAAQTQFVPSARWAGQTARLGCWWARESARYLVQDSAGERPRIVHEERLWCAAQDFRWRLTVCAVRLVFSELAAFPAKVNSRASETIFCTAQALPPESAPAKLPRLADRRNKGFRFVPESPLRRKSNSRFQSGYRPRVQGIASLPLSSIH